MMTCIVGLKHSGRVYMIGDSAAGYERTTTTPKVFINGDLIIGYTWSFRMGQILQYDQDMPKISTPTDKYIANEFIPHVRETLKNHGLLKIEDSVEAGGQFIVGVLGDLYIVHSDFSFHQYAEDYIAIGCGEEYALGAMRILCEDVVSNPSPILEKAIMAAAHFDAGVRPPFYTCRL